MKPESLLIVGQPYVSEFFLGPCVHTARHTMGHGHAPKGRDEILEQKKVLISKELNEEPIPWYLASRKLPNKMCAKQKYHKYTPKLFITKKHI